MFIVTFALCMTVFFASMAYVLRVRAGSAANSQTATLSRLILSVLLLAFVGVVWYYTSVSFLQSATIERNVRIVSALIYLALLPEIWINDDTGEF